MRRLPIEGKGLGAIIRDTTRDEPGVVSEEDRAELESVKRDFKEKSVSYTKRIEDLRSELSGQEAKAQFLENEIIYLKKIFADEIPQTEDAELMIETFRRKAEEFERKKNLLDAFYLYRRIIKLDPQNINALYQLATIYYSVDFPGKAAECLRAILEIDPDHTEAAESLEEIEREL